MIPFSTKHYACSPLMLTFHRLISIIKQKSTPPFRSPQSSQTPTASEKNEMKQEFQALKKTFVEFQLNFDAKLDAAAFSADQGPDFERAQLLWQVPFLHICPGPKEAVPLGFLP